MDSRRGRVASKAAPADELTKRKQILMGQEKTDPETKQALRVLCDRWRDSRIKLKQAANCPDLGEDGKIGVGLYWANDALKAEDEAAELVLISAGVILPGEPVPTRGFEPVSIEVNGTWSVVVAPARTVADRRIVVFMARTATST